MCGIRLWKWLGARTEKDKEQKYINNRKGKGMDTQLQEQKVKGKENWGIKFLKNYYVYLVSSLLIVITSLIVLAMKQAWPFGDSSLLAGDYLYQTWPFLTDLREKLQTGESIIYTWHAGYGTNLYSILAFGMFNPISLILILAPKEAFIPLGTVIYVLILVMMNCSMIFYLTHRQGPHLRKDQIANMLFSISYACCMYTVANSNLWYFLLCAVLFPLIILGLENYVAGKSWTLYAITLALAFIFNYYFAGLFCIYIILYYLTLQFKDARDFAKKSIKILGISIVSILISSVILIPTAMQMMGQSYTASTYKPGIWFTTIFDIIKNLFIFNRNIGIGSEATSYGEVSLYFGLLVLLLTTLFFLNRKIRKSIRIKKLILVIIYIVAFDLNGLNYVMHLFHYPSWYPNRFSLFFVLLCIILAYEAWVSMEEEMYQNITILKGLVVGIGWLLATVLCFAFAENIDYQFTYYYSMMIFMFYMVSLLILPLAKQKWARILVVIGSVEICCNFVFAVIFKSIQGQMTTRIDRDIVMRDVLDSADLEEHMGFSRSNSGQDLLVGKNSGMLYGYNGTSIFASSIGDIKTFLSKIGINAGGNIILPYTYSIPTASLLGVQYIIADNLVSKEQVMPGSLFSMSQDLYAEYEEIKLENDIVIYENPTVLSLGYMVPADVEKYEEAMNQEISGIENINYYTEAVSGVTNVFERMNLEIKNIETINCYGVLDNEQIYLASDKETFEDQEITLSAHALTSKNNGEYLQTENSYIRLDYEAAEDGVYYACINSIMTYVGELKKGEVGYFCVNPAEFVTGEQWVFSTNITLYRFQEDKWKQAYEKLSQQQLNVTHYDSTTVDGTIEVKEDGIFFTSVPYDKSWHLYVDGEEIEIHPLWYGAFVSTTLSEGTHSIHLEYRQCGLGLGIAGSIVAAVLLAGWILFERRHKNVAISEKS